MILIFAHHYDEEAKWLYKYLPVHSGASVKLVVAEALGIDYYISLSIKKDSCNAFVFFNDTSELVACDDVTMVINRLTFINPIAWNRSDEKEKAYATNEINAFFAAFLYSYKCPVINSIAYGSLFGSNSGILKLIKSLKQAGIAVHPSVFEENENSFKKMEANAAECLRIMIWNNEIFFPPHQLHTEFYDTLKETFKKTYVGPTHELFFINYHTGFELIYISRSPALSMYGQPFLQHLSETVHTVQSCY